MNGWLICIAVCSALWLLLFIFNKNGKDKGGK